MDEKIANDFALIDAAIQARDEVSEDWEEYEDIYRNKLNEDMKRTAKQYGRTYSQTPIAHDTVEIKRSIFASSFNSNNLPINVDGFGEVGEEVARQLRLAGSMMWKRSVPYVELNKAMLRMLVFPVAILACYWDARRSKIVVNEINPMDIAFDPDASSPDDVQYYTYERYMTNGELLRLATPKKVGKKKRKPWFNEINKVEDVFEDYDKSTFQRFERQELIELYTLEDDGRWLCKTYLEHNKKLLHKQYFNSSPFSWGFALDNMSSIDENDREDEIMVYGQSEIKNLEPYVEDMIMRKNQHADIIEKNINPDVFVPSNSGIKASLLKRGSGTYIPYKGNAESIKFRPAPSAIGVLDAMSMAKSDIEDTSAINGFYKAQTSASDRRSTGAIALLESKASTRIEMQILTAKATLFDHFAKNYMALVYQHAPKNLLNMLDIDVPLIGRAKMNKPNMKNVVSVEFGADIDRDRRYASLMEAAQVLGQFQNVDPRQAEALVTEALKIKVGDRVKISDELFAPQTLTEPQVQEELPPPQEVIDVPIQEVPQAGGVRDVAGGI